MDKNLINKFENNKIYSNQEEIINTIVNNKTCDLEKYIKKNEVNTLLAYSQIRTNIISWYPFKKDSVLLQIGGALGEITIELCKKIKKIICIVGNEEEKNVVLARCRDFNNLEIIIWKENIEQTIQEKFDYILSIGSLELYNDIINESGKEKFEKIINHFKSHLKENGKFLIAFDNKYGMKYFANIYANKNIVGNSKFTLSKNDSSKILLENGFKNIKYYYPLPDYKLTNVIFSDEYLPDIENISRSFIYNENEFVSFNFMEGYTEILKDDKEIFKYFANSYFIEATTDIKIENKIKFVSFTNLRKNKYRIKTIIGNEIVEKHSFNENSESHINQIKQNIKIMKELNIDIIDNYDENKVYSSYIENLITYDKFLIELLKNNKKEEFKKVILNYKDFLINKLVKVDEPYNDNIFQKYNVEYKNESLKNMIFLKYGFWDLIFQNIFYDKDNLIVFDQEWFDNNVPVEYILYRAFTYFREIEKYISKAEIFEFLNLTEYIEIFEQLDSKIQLKIRDEMIWDFNQNIRTGQTLNDLYKNLLNEINELKINKENEIFNLNQLLKNYEENNKKLLEENLNLNKRKTEIESSFLWKVSKPIRKIENKINKKK